MCTLLLIPPLLGFESDLQICRAIEEVESGPRATKSYCSHQQSHELDLIAAPMNLSIEIGLIGILLRKQGYINQYIPEKPEQVFAWVDLTAGCQTATEEKPATLYFSATMAFCKPTILSIAIELVARIPMPSSFLVLPSISSLLLLADAPRKQKEVQTKKQAPDKLQTPAHKNNPTTTMPCAKP